MTAVYMWWGGQSPAVYLTPTTCARDCIRDFTPWDILYENCIMNMTKKLDMLFLKDQSTHAYLVFREFYNFNCPSSINITYFGKV